MISQVEKAKAVLALFAPSTVEAIKTKQRQHMLLAKEVDLIKEMVAEGLLSNKNAEAFIEEITQDSIRVEQERNQLTR